MAGATRPFPGEAELSVLSDELHPFYDRVRLPEYLSGGADWQRLLKSSGDELDTLAVRVQAGVRVQNVDRVAKVVVDQEGAAHPYDKLVFATGSRPFVPPAAPVGAPGIFSMRSRGDADALKVALDGSTRIAIVGGGLLGLELAGVLSETGLSVTVVDGGPRLMERQLDPVASELLLEIVTERGIEVRLNELVKGARPTRAADRRVVDLVFASGDALQVDAVVFSAGTVPNVEVLAEAKVACGRGALVNGHLQTSDPDIYAVGEVAEHRGTLHGITAAAEEQAFVAARHLMGDPLAVYEGSVRVNVLKFPGVDVCSIGLPAAPPGAAGFEEITILDRGERYYKKCVISGDRLVGAILIGGREELVEFRELIANGTELSGRRRGLLGGAVPRPPVLGRLVCSCAQVGEGNLAASISWGATSLEALCGSSGAGVTCGSCRSEVRRLLKQSLAEAFSCPSGVKSAQM